MEGDPTIPVRLETNAGAVVAEALSHQAAGGADSPSSGGKLGGKLSASIASWGSALKERTQKASKAARVWLPPHTATPTHINPISVPLAGYLCTYRHAPLLTGNFQQRICKIKGEIQQIWDSVKGVNQGACIILPLLIPPRCTHRPTPHYVDSQTWMSPSGLFKGGADGNNPYRSNDVRAIKLVALLRLQCLKICQCPLGAELNAKTFSHPPHHRVSHMTTPSM